jgi:hypothetical protein
MRKIAFCLIASMAFLFVAAQQDTTLQQYTGKYVFKEGSAVPDMTVTLNENGVLIASSVQGSSELKKTEGDVFTIVAYNGLATFKRNDAGKVSWVKVEVGDIVLEGTRQESNAALFPHFALKPKP